MHEAVEHLSKTQAGLSEKSRRRRKSSYDMEEEDRLPLVEGWFLLFLLVAVVYSAIWCLQFAITSPSMSFLTYVTALGLGLGVYAAYQTRIPRWLYHIAIVLVALFLAYWLASGVTGVDTSDPLFQRIILWFNVMAMGGVSNDDAIFVFFVAALGFLLAYASAWLIYGKRTPWLMIAANATILLLSLNNSSPSLIVFMVIFVLASMLLLLRFNLAEWLIRWRQQGLRHSDDLSWDIMQAGSLISIGIIVFSWILPGSYLNPLLSRVWNANNGPVGQVTAAWNRLFAIRGSAEESSRGNFSENLILGGNPNLSNEVVFTLTTREATVPYLAFVSYDNYGNGRWAITGAEITDGVVKENIPIVMAQERSRSIDVSITIKNPPTEQHPYIAGPSVINQLNRPARLLLDQSGGIIAWLSPGGNLPAGVTYTVKSTVSAADIGTLKTVPMPEKAPPYQVDPLIPNDTAPINAYPPSLLKMYTQLPKNLDPRIKITAQDITESEPTMYEKMEALEHFLRGYKYSLDVNPPSGVDPVSWFLFDGKKGFCNYYASAMVLMARSLGVPARVVTGYRYGSPENGVNVIRGKDAHSWPQIYFAGYGWINFEPTAAFQTFTRPLPNQYKPADNPTTNTGAIGPNIPLPTTPFRDTEAEGGGSNGHTGNNAQISLNRAFAILSATLFLLVIFSGILVAIWWRRLFRRYSLASQIYGRIYTLANLAGIKWQASQTPYEYLHKFSLSALPGSADASSLERLGDIYVRERWADPESPEHPLQSGEIKELPTLWLKIRPHLFRYTLLHPYFLRWLPMLVWRQLVRIWQAVRSRRSLDDEF